MPATAKKKGLKGLKDRLTWQYFFALVFTAVAIAILIAGLSPWYYVPTLLVAGGFGIAGRRATKVQGTADAQALPGGPSITTGVDVRFADEESEDRS